MPFLDKRSRKTLDEFIRLEQSGEPLGFEHTRLEDDTFVNSIERLSELKFITVQQYIDGGGKIKLTYKGRHYKAEYYRGILRYALSQIIVPIIVGVTASILTTILIK